MLASFLSLLHKESPDDFLDDCGFSNFDLVSRAELSSPRQVDLIQLEGPERGLHVDVGELLLGELGDSIGRVISHGLIDSLVEEVELDVAAEQ